MGTDCGVPSCVRHGCYARIEGVKSQVDLNGQLCRVLRPADSGDGGDGRWVVSVRGGVLKSLRSESLIAPSGAMPYRLRSSLGAAFMLSTLLVLAAVGMAQRGTMPPPLLVVAFPLAAIAWLLGTLGTCYRLHAALRNPAISMPAISEMALLPPARLVYQIGFTAVGTLLAATMFFFEIFIVPRLVEASAPGGGDKYDKAMSTATACVRFGYGAAVGVVLQGVLTLELEMTWKTSLHLMGAMVYMMGTMQHAALSNQLFADAANQTAAIAAAGADEALAAQSAAMPAGGAQLRWACANYGPMGLLVLPLALQVWQRLARSSGNQPSTGGMENAMGIMQWALVLNFAVFYVSYAFDFIAMSPDSLN